MIRPLTRVNAALRYPRVTITFRSVTAKGHASTFAGIDLAKGPLVIAEIGNNHEGDFELAREMVRRAVDCGVSGVKFQTFRTEHYVSRSDAARFERLTRFQLTFDQFAELADLAHSLGVLFVSTPLDLLSAEFLTEHVDFFKVASADNNFYPLLATIASARKPVVVSTGLSDLAQIERCASFLRDQWTAHGHDGDLAALHCVSCYPSPPEQACLGAIRTIREKLQCVVGYSDHTIGLEAALAAIALGADIVEKHFTLDKNYSDFRDHQLSADPPEMRQLVERARHVRVLVGTGEKRVQPCEEAHAALIRRSIVAAENLPAGKPLQMEDLTWIRPAGGLSPGQESLLVGKRLRRPVSFGERLGTADVE